MEVATPSFKRSLFLFSPGILKVIPYSFPSIINLTYLPLYSPISSISLSGLTSLVIVAPSSNSVWSFTGSVYTLFPNWILQESISASSISWVGSITTSSSASVTVSLYCASELCNAGVSVEFASSFGPQLVITVVRLAAIIRAKIAFFFILCTSIVFFTDKYITVISLCQT